MLIKYFLITMQTQLQEPRKIHKQEENPNIYLPSMVQKLSKPKFNLAQSWISALKISQHNSATSSLLFSSLQIFSLGYQVGR